MTFHAFVDDDSNAPWPIPDSAMPSPVTGADDLRDATGDRAADVRQPTKHRQEITK